MTGLGDLPGSIFQSQATGVSADGSTVVGHSYSNSSDEAFVWDEIGGMRELDQVLIDLGIDLTGWTQREAIGVFDDGRPASWLSLGNTQGPVARGASLRRC